MRRYEYLVLHVIESDGLGTQINALNAAGADGWELVAVTPQTSVASALTGTTGKYYFKREVMA